MPSESYFGNRTACKERRHQISNEFACPARSVPERNPYELYKTALGPVFAYFAKPRLLCPVVQVDLTTGESMTNVIVDNVWSSVSHLLSPAKLWTQTTRNYCFVGQFFIE